MSKELACANTVGALAWITTDRETVELFGPIKPKITAKATTARRMIKSVLSALMVVGFSESCDFSRKRAVQFHCVTYPWHDFPLVPKKIEMRPFPTRPVHFFTLLPLLTMLAFSLPACKSSSPAGAKVKMPFTGNKYESNNRFFRGTGSGVSVKQNIARGKADIDAKNQLAAQVKTNIRTVTDQYLGQTENAEATEVADKFQSLVREVMNTEMADLRKVGEETRYNETSQGIHAVRGLPRKQKKNAMFRFMKKQAKTDDKINDVTRRIDEILDEEIKKADAEDRLIEHPLP